MEININKNYNINRLQYWLDYELSTSLLFLISWFWSISIFLMIIAALVFTPFLLKILYEERRFGWIISFFIIVLIPTVVTLIIEVDLAYKLIIGLVPLAFFYFYCFTLRLVIRDWKV